MAAHWLEITHEARGSRARAGVLHTRSGAVETPLLCVVGSGGSVGGATPADLRGLGVGVLLARTYELLAWPGSSVVQALGGVHALTGWDGPIVTDSGGAEVFALGASGPGRGNLADQASRTSGSARRPRGQTARLLRMDDDGATYTSPHDGSPQRLTPESAVAAQEALGGDIMAALHRPARPGADASEAARAMAQTHAWARRCLAARSGQAPASGQALYGVVQAGPVADSQRASAAAIGRLSFDGVVVDTSWDRDRDRNRNRNIGGSLDRVVPHLPSRWPRQARASGELGELVRWVEGGIDLVEYPAPTRAAQSGLVYADGGTRSARDPDWRDDPAPVDQDCACYTCRRGFSRGYLHHLFACDELLGYTLATLHNVHTAVRLMQDIRDAVVADRLAEWHAELRSGATAAPK